MTTARNPLEDAIYANVNKATLSRDWVRKGEGKRVGECVEVRLQRWNMQAQASVDAATATVDTLTSCPFKFFWPDSIKSSLELGILKSRE